MGLAQLVLYFGWTWVGLLAADNDYGQQGIQLVRQELLKGGACVAFTENIVLNLPDHNAQHIIKVIRESTVKVIVVFSTDVDLMPILDEMLRQNITDITFVASDAWSTTSVQSIETYSELLVGTIGLAFYSGAIPGFKRFLGAIHPAMPLGRDWIRIFWEEAFGCKFEKEHNSTGVLDMVFKQCTGEENLENIQNSFTDVSNLRTTYNVYAAVHIVAQALEDLNNCISFEGTMSNNHCADIYHFKSWQLLHFISKVRVKLNDGRIFHFDENGDPPAVYDIVNWQLTPDGAIRQMKVGSYDSAAGPGQVLTINSIFYLLKEPIVRPLLKKPSLEPDVLSSYKPLTNLRFLGKVIEKAAYLQLEAMLSRNNISDLLQSGFKKHHSCRNSPHPYLQMICLRLQNYCGIDGLVLQWFSFFLAVGTKEVALGPFQSNPVPVPFSQCSESCPTGFWRAAREGEPICCFECFPCPLGEITNKTDSVDCFKCPWDQWPNSQKSTCLLKALQYLSFEDPMGISLTVISAISSLTPNFILRLFIKHKFSPVVKANNFSVSVLLLVSLSLCFLSSLAFIGYPQPEKCLLRQAMFGLVFALCISCILAKTVMVVLVFMATKPGTSLKKWTTPQTSYLIIIIGFMIQLILCINWLSLAPPFPQYSMQAQPVLIIECYEGSPIAFWAMLGYLFLLATICFIVAFLARRLPDCFNEAQYITFSMLAFLSVWISFIPAYFSAQGKYTVAMEIFAILVSSWALVICMFLPKCFIILFRHDLNSKEHIMKRNKT
ncbi:extracellular calcium-sensing receptor-like [Hyperolius riggenbachi]|uniref:extracellular calcium-sensing receptor-like n=1 Tax=Hyperolius riggenbachi TaxID=752182 RepID=UPI0035A2C089